MSVVDDLQQLMDRTDTSYSEAAVASRTSPSTIRWVIQTRELPRRRPTRERLERFVAANRDARTRAEIKFAE